MGQEEFTRLVRYAYDNGIRFFETADAYHSMPEMLSVALKGLPRYSYRLMTKYDVHHSEDPMAAIHRLNGALGADYVDIMLLHCVRSPNWPEETKHLQDAFQEAKEKKLMMAHGASVHGKQALAVFPGNPFLDVAMIRMNHNDAHGYAVAARYRRQGRRSVRRRGHAADEGRRRGHHQHEAGG